jgi:hypothetical protein
MKRSPVQGKEKSFLSPVEILFSMVVNNETNPDKIEFLAAASRPESTTGCVHNL